MLPNLPRAWATALREYWIDFHLDTHLTGISKSTKAQPKQAVAGKTETTIARGTGRPVRGARGRVRRGRNAGRPKPKTADELDAEMTDYFTTTPAGNNEAAPTTNGAAPAAATSDDTGMDGIA